MDNFSDIAEALLDLAGNHNFSIKFNRHNNGQVFISVCDEYSEIAGILANSCNIAFPILFEMCQEWIDEQDSKG